MPAKGPVQTTYQQSLTAGIRPGFGLSSQKRESWGGSGTFFSIMVHLVMMATTHLLSNKRVAAVHGLTDR